MEHRWGRRVVVNHPVRVGFTVTSLVIARLRDVSGSGAFLETSLNLPVLSRVYLQLRMRGRKAASRDLLSAQVVRCDPKGFALEWCEFAPAVILDWLQRSVATPPLHCQAARQRVARSSGGRQRVVEELHHPGFQGILGTYH